MTNKDAIEEANENIASNFSTEPCVVKALLDCISDGTPKWGAFDSNGKLRALLESEAEAYFYVKNRSHMHGGSHRVISANP